MSQDYSSVFALIKDDIVINTIVFEGEDPLFIDNLKSSLEVDKIINGGGREVPPGIGMTYDSENDVFIPIPIPVVDGPLPPLALHSEE